MQNVQLPKKLQFMKFIKQNGEYILLNSFEQLDKIPNSFFQACNLLNNVGVIYL